MVNAESTVDRSQKRKDFIAFLSAAHDLHRVRLPDGFVHQMLPPIRCKDGFTISVQASQIHYCSPKSNSAEWTHFEVGYPSSEEPLLAPYILIESDDGDVVDYTESVYPNTPIDILIDVLERHGGVDGIDKVHF